MYATLAFAITSSIGVLYSTNANFSTYSSTTIQSNITAGTYTSTISGLAPSTTYYAKSFIVNKAGTSYGPIISFTTSANPIAFKTTYHKGNHFFVVGGTLDLITSTSSQNLSAPYALFQNTNSAAKNETGEIYSIVSVPTVRSY